MNSDIRRQVKDLLLELSDTERWELILELGGQYPWYQLVNEEDIKQGDILEDCPVFQLPENLVDLTKAKLETTAKVEWREQDVIVMSQSCDMVKGREKVSETLLCPIWKRSELNEGYLASSGGMEEARRGNLPGFHVLAECSLPNFHSEVRVVDFRRVYSLPLPLVRRLAIQTESRIRLLPPYREQLAQAFARYFMRVGLPTDIPPFASSKPEKTEAEVIKKLQIMDKEAQNRVLSYLINELNAQSEVTKQS